MPSGIPADDRARANIFIRSRYQARNCASRSKLSIAAGRQLRLSLVTPDKSSIKDTSVAKQALEQSDSLTQLMGMAPVGTLGHWFIIQIRTTFGRDSIWRALL